MPSPKFRRLKAPAQFVRGYLRALRELRLLKRDWRIYRELQFGAGAHPAEYRDYECAFAAEHISRLAPCSLLDVGSYRHFLIGLMANRDVTTLDVRPRAALLPNEKVVTADAKNANLPPNSFDLVLCLSTLEHFGLGRYGDEVDFDADRAAFSGLTVLVKPGGHFVYSTSITRFEPSIVFNAHRIYTREVLRRYAAGLRLIEERYYSKRLRRWCGFEEVTAQPKRWDVICVCCQKPD
jgi:SAM-dependent methyltransferase